MVYESSSSDDDSADLFKDELAQCAQENLTPNKDDVSVASNTTSVDETVNNVSVDHAFGSDANPMSDHVVPIAQAGASVEADGVEAKVGNADEIGVANEISNADENRNVKGVDTDEVAGAVCVEMLNEVENNTIDDVD